MAPETFNKTYFQVGRYTDRDGDEKKNSFQEVAFRNMSTTENLVVFGVVYTFIAFKFPCL